MFGKSKKKVELQVGDRRLLNDGKYWTFNGYSFVLTQYFTYEINTTMNNGDWFVTKHRTTEDYYLEYSSTYTSVNVKIINLLIKLGTGDSDIQLNNGIHILLDTGGIHSAEFVIDSGDAR